MKTPLILVVGSSNTDMIIRVERIPKPGETLIGSQFQMVAGGKGANQAVAAARAGGRVAFVNRVGDDVFGSQTIPRLSEDGIDTANISIDPDSPSGVALIMVSSTGENSIAVAPGANGKLAPDDIQNARDCFKEANLLLVQLEVPMETVAAAVELAAENSVQVILNPAPANEIPSEVLEKVNIITPNETETELLTGIEVIDEQSARKAANALHHQGVDTVIITRGSEGAFVSDGNEAFSVPAFSQQVVDTTAAGDVFNGTLSVALVEGRPLREAVAFACAAAGISTTILGAQPSIPDRVKIDELMATITRELNNR